MNHVPNPDATDLSDLAEWYMTSRNYEPDYVDISDVEFDLDVFDEVDG